MMQTKYTAQHRTNYVICFERYLQIDPINVIPFTVNVRSDDMWAAPSPEIYIIASQFLWVILTERRSKDVRAELQSTLSASESSVFP